MLTKEILCAYAPHGVKVTNGKETVEVDINNIGDTWIAYKHGEFKLILRPLSSLTKPITYNGETFVPMDYIKNNYRCFGFDYDEEDGFLLNTDVVNYKYLPYMIIKKLLSWHFDIFGLIGSHAIELKEVDNGE